VDDRLQKEGHETKLDLVLLDEAVLNFVRSAMILERSTSLRW